MSEGREDSTTIPQVARRRHVSVTEVRILCGDAIIATTVHCLSSAGRVRDSATRVKWRLRLRKEHSEVCILQEWRCIRKHIGTPPRLWGDSTKERPPPGGFRQRVSRWQQKLNLHHGVFDTGRLRENTFTYRTRFSTHLQYSMSIVRYRRWRPLHSPHRDSFLWIPDLFATPNIPSVRWVATMPRVRTVGRQEKAPHTR